MAPATCLVAGILLSLALSCYGQMECPFFGQENRKATPKTNLGNCSWYEHSSCCERAEITAVFAEMLTLQGASQSCRNRVNYMMCYFCDPRQRNFIFNAPRQASVCSSFCDDTLSQCHGARSNGATLGSRYSSGREFCEANFFVYETRNSAPSCFQFNASAFSAAPTIHASQYSVVPLVALSASITLLQGLF